MILNKIAEDTRRRVERQKEEVPFEKVKAMAAAMQTDTGFPFEKSLRQEGMQFICEVKKASPSKGVIAEDFPYTQIAREYEMAGAAAISVLTEPNFFLGSPDYLKEIRKEVSIPLLRKDFTIDAYQIYEAKTLGADAVLLITALLDMATLGDYIDICDDLGLTALVEVHDKKEMETALAAGARVIGVNNRNLKDFTVDIGNSIRLRSLAPQTCTFVAESGISTRKDIEELEAAKVDGVLIGEAFMRSSDKKAELNRLRGLEDE